MPFLNVNSPAPDFTLPDQDGKEHTLSYHRGSWILLYFYPKDDTAGCTKEACMIRDEFPAFGKLNAKVFGVSADSIESHKKFAEEYQLPFTLLADVDKKAINAYGVTSRTSFLINPDGKIAKIYESVRPEIHAAEVLADLTDLEKMR